jgi:hypothetical protein
VGSLFPLQIKEPVSSGKCGKIISHEYERGFPLSVLRSGRPMYIHKPHILASAAETGFYDLKSKFPLNLKNKISAVQC